MPDYTGNLASVTTQDTSSTIANCIYPKLAIGGAPVPTTVIVNNQPLLMIAGDYVCAPVPPTNTNTPPLPLCPAGTRTVKAETCTNVFINGQNPVIKGDSTKLLGSSDRLLTGPFQYPRIKIGTQT